MISFNSACIFYSISVLCLVSAIFRFSNCFLLFVIALFLFVMFLLPDHFRSTLDAVAEVCILWAQSRLFKFLLSIFYTTLCIAERGLSRHWYVRPSVRSPYQTWTWVNFLKPNPTQPTKVQTQPTTCCTPTQPNSFPYILTRDYIVCHTVNFLVQSIKKLKKHTHNFTSEYKCRMLNKTATLSNQSQKKTY